MCLPTLAVIYSGKRHASVAWVEQLSIDTLWFPLTGFVYRLKKNTVGYKFGSCLLKVREEKKRIE